MLSDSDRVSVLTEQAVRAAVQDVTARRESDGGRPALRTPPMLGVTHGHLTGESPIQGLDGILEQVLVGIETPCRRAGYIPFPWQQSRLLTTDEGRPFFASVSGGS